VSAAEALPEPEPEPGLGLFEAALTAARLFAVDPHGLGGVALRAQAGPVRDVWLRALRILLPAEAPIRRVPLHVGEDRLLGGLDLAATLATGRPVAERGLLAAADGGVLILAMAERAPGSTISAVTAAMDQGVVAAERDGLTLRHSARFGVIALDEGIGEDEGLPAALLDRQAFRLELERVVPSEAVVAEPAIEAEGGAAVTEARARLTRVTLGHDVAEALASTALALGIDSLRAVILALRAARAAAALDGAASVGEAHARLAAEFVLAPRATQLPMSPEEAAEDQPPPDQEPPPDEQQEPPPESLDDQRQPEAMPDLEDLILAAAAAAIPPGLLAQLQLQRDRRGPGRGAGKAGAPQQSRSRGRPLGTRRGLPRGGQRLALVDTLRAAAPWQPLRRRERGSLAPDAKGDAAKRVEVRPDDCRITRFKQRSETTVVFVVDASGSTAFNRLAEAKGAVELLLADCYVRRESVALIAFRGTGAELLLPPTRSLTRAKRSLAGLPGGGGTPLAAGLEAAADLADAVSRKGQTPILILLSDGSGNIARDGQPGRAAAEADATAAASRLRLAGHTTLFIDTSPRARPKARELAVVMAARYLALPRADSLTLSNAVKAGTAALRPTG
jgi:magnesium chelatase subunit D